MTAYAYKCSQNSVYCVCTCTKHVQTCGNMYFCIKETDSSNKNLHFMCVHKMTLWLSIKLLESKLFSMFIVVSCVFLETE